MKRFTYSDTLELDLYSATGDTAWDKPLLLLVHGGGFAVGKKDNPLEKGFCTTMAKKGYAVASISYRLTRKDKSFGCDCPAKEKITTFLAATEDVLKATRFLKDRAKTLKLDPDTIILIGSSAGAEAVLNTAFMQYHPEFRKLPYKNLGYAGVISFAGGVLDADYITPKNALPSLMFHGEKDRLVPFGTAPHHYCPETSPGYLLLDGSETISEKLGQLGIAYTLAVDQQGNHDWANLPYAHTDLIADFIKASILEGKIHQTKITLSKEP
ncbi:MAG: alpha/beta hydrolase [Bacteroidota bacterium]